MTRTMRLVEDSQSAPLAWPSIASASAQLRRRRFEKASARAETPAVPGNVAPLRAAVPVHRRTR